MKPGGFFHIAEFHPFCTVFHNEEAESGLEIRYPYFEGDAIRFEEDGTYADREAKLQNKVTYSWAFTIGGVVTSLIEAGLRIEFLHEHPLHGGAVLAADGRSGAGKMEAAAVRGIDPANVFA